MTPVVELDRVVKTYGGLRPLRIAALAVADRERVAIAGLDAAAAEVFVSLVTGAALPDEGVIRTFGGSTADLAGGDEWLASLDRFGIVSPRAVMLEAATLEQNLAIPFALEIDPVPPGVAGKVAALAALCGIDRGLLTTAVADLPPHVRARAHLARAVALNPQLLLLEHPTAGVPPLHRHDLARDVAAVAESRALTTIAITLDEEFAARVAHRSLTLNAATGALTAWKKTKRWWS